MESGQGFGKRPERFRFQEDWAIDLSEGEISAFREPGIRKTENRGERLHHGFPNRESR
jgi:hypothetical protein